MAGNILYISAFILAVFIAWSIIRSEEAKRIPNKYGFSLTNYKCFIDNDYGIFATKAECEVALQAAKPKASIDQSCVNKKCVAGMFCNKNLVCENAKSYSEVCQPGECGEGLYCAPDLEKGTGVCLPGLTTVPELGSCDNTAFICDPALECVSGKCQKKVSLQISITMDAEVYTASVNAVAVTAVSAPGMQVFGFSGSRLVFSNYYNLPLDPVKETQRFISDSKAFTTLGVTTLIVTIYKTNPANVPLNLRSVLLTIGAEALKYADNNYIAVLDFRRRVRLYEDVSRTVNYTKTLTLSGL